MTEFRFRDEEDDEADDFFYAVGPDLVCVAMSDKMKLCMRRFTY